MMENFDIEKLERKNIFKTPDNFFEDMQANVLKNTVGAEIKPLTIAKPINKKNNNFWWYAAASLILLFGLWLSFDFLNKNESVPAEEAVVVKENTPIEETAEPIVAKIEEPQEVVKEDLTNEVKAYPKYTEVKPESSIARTEVKKTQEVAVKESFSASKSTDEILSVLPQEDIVSLANDAAADVYLDLYN